MFAFLWFVACVLSVLVSLLFLLAPLLRYILYGYFCTFSIILLLRLCQVSKQASRAQGPFVQSIVNLTSSLVAKILTVLVSTISNSQVFLLKDVSIFHIFQQTY